MIKICLLEILDHLGMSQIELSELTGIRPATINQFYHEDVKRMNLDYLDRICNALQCQVSDILVHEPDKPHKKDNSNYTPSLKHFLINGYKTLKLM